jgi:hypothetical protein
MVVCMGKCINGWLLFLEKIDLHSQLDRFGLGNNEVLQYT